MPRTIITHVGASLLRDECGAFYGFPERDNLLSSLRNNQDVKYYYDSAAAHLARELAVRWGAQTERYMRESPAEIASLSLLEIGFDDQIVLLHSDTGEGAFCAEVLTRVLKIDLNRASEPHNNYPFCAAVEARRIEGLKVVDDFSIDANAAETSDSFVRHGLASYVRHVWEAYDELYKHWNNLRDASAFQEGALIFNITAGYKGMIPIARDLALLLLAYSERLKRTLTTEVCYLYEESTRLIRYESLPVQFDWGRVTMPQLKRAAAEDEPSERTPGSSERQLWSEIALEEQRYFQPTGPNAIYARLSPLGRVVLELGERIDHGAITTPPK